MNMEDLRRQMSPSKPSIISCHQTLICLCERKGCSTVQQPSEVGERFGRVNLKVVFLKLVQGTYMLSISGKCICVLDVIITHWVVDGFGGR
jgi:hypothetical protein